MNDRHLVHYLILFLGLSVTLVAFVVFRYNLTIQIVVAGIGCLFYIAWGIIHHVLEGRLSRLVTLEYILFGSLAFLIFFASAYI